MLFRYSPKQLRDHASKFYPSQKYLNDIRTLLDLYEDRNAEKHTAKYLGKDNVSMPLHMNVLRNIINRIAVAYDAPPLRVLVDPSGNSLATFSPEARTLEEYLKRASYDAKMSEINQYKELLSTVFVRFYPDNESRSFAAHLITPDLVFRAPSHESPGSISSDEAFCIELFGGETFEYWERSSLGWICFIVDESGQIISKPFGDDGLCPYGLLPVLALHNAAGAKPYAYFPIQESRISHQLTINKQLTDLDNIIGRQGFSPVVITTPNGERFKELRLSPERGITLEPGEEIETLDQNPLLQDSLKVIQTLIRNWTEIEGLPAEQEWTLYKSGPGEKAKLLPLYEKRKKMLPLIRKEQERAYNIISSIISLKAPDWSSPDLPVGLRLEVRSQHADDLEELNPQQVQAALIEIQAGLSSSVEYLRLKTGCSREEAEALFELYRNDAIMFPLPGNSKE